MIYASLCSESRRSHGFRGAVCIHRLKNKILLSHADVNDTALKVLYTVILRLNDAPNLPK